MIRKKGEFQESRGDKCHGGEGFFDCKLVMEPGDSKMGIEFMHDDILEPGTIFGEHLHADTEEVYYVMEGHGTAMLDGERFPVSAGDVTFVKAGHTHGIINEGDTPMRLIVVGVKQ